MTTETLVVLVVFLFPLAYSPGPGNAFFAAIGATRGVRAAVPALAGYHVATVVVTLLIGLSVGVTVLTNPIVSRVLSIVGSLYILWIASRFLRAAWARTRASVESERGSLAGSESVESARSEQATSAAKVGFWAGIVVLVVNPKAYAIIAAMFTQFLRPPLNDDVLVVVAITTVFTINNLIAFIAWTALGRALTVLFRSERGQRVIDYLFAVMLIGVAIWMLIPVFA